MTKKGIVDAVHVLDVERLQHDPGYQLIQELDFNDMIPFVLTSIRKRGFISTLYVVLNLGFLIGALLIILIGLVNSQLTWTMIIKQTLLGVFFGSILIIPIHELLHGMAYRILGARNIKYGADLQQLIFYVTADRHPVSGIQLHFLALTPIVVINFFLAALVLIWFPNIILFSTLFLLSHNVMCIGDFAMVNYVRHQNRKVFNFDDTEKKKSYFYAQIDSKTDMSTDQSSSKAV